MIRATSRYSRSDVVSFRVEEGHIRKALTSPVFYGMTFLARRHVVSEGERLDTLASGYYEDPNLWWLIAAGNPEHILPDEIPAGSVIRIPDAATVR
jgi:hypothetical protein